MKRFFRTFFLSLFLGQALYGADLVSIPNTFSANTYIKSAQVNANFTAIGNAISDGTSQIYAAVIKAATSFQAPNGTVSSPAVQFTNDTDTGLYLATTGEIAVAASGVQAFIITNSVITSNVGMDIDDVRVTGNTITSLSGNLTISPASGSDIVLTENVGIGTSTPQNRLDASGAMALGASYAGTNTAPSNGLLVEGAVGIGTTAPQNKLDVEGAAVIGATYSGTNTAPSNGLLVEGNVGIGTTSPSELLHVSAGNIAVDPNYKLILNSGFGGNNWIESVGTSSAYISIVNASSPSLIIDADGQVGVGITSPLQDLHVYNGTSNDNGNVQIGGNASAGLLIGYESVASGRVGFSSANNAGANNNRISFGFGTMSSGEPQNIGLMLDQDLNLGVGGVVTPFNKVDIEGSVAIGSSYSGSYTAPSQGLIVEGSVGIGTSAPINKVDIEGAAVIGATYSGTNTAPSNGLLVEGTVGIGITNPSFGNLVVQGSTATFIDIVATTTTSFSGISFREENGLNGSGYLIQYNSQHPTLANTFEIANDETNSGIIFDLNGSDVAGVTGNALSLYENGLSTSSPNINTEVRIYRKGDKLIIQSNDGLDAFWYLDLTTKSTQSLTYSATEP